MSRRYEVADTRTDIGVLSSAEAVEEEVLTKADIAIGRRALIIGDPYATAYAVVGTPDELARFVTTLGTFVDGMRS